jgi:hypothetical protein
VRPVTPTRHETFALRIGESGFQRAGPPPAPHLISWTPIALLLLLPLPNPAPMVPVLTMLMNFPTRHDVGPVPQIPALSGPLI